MKATTNFVLDGKRVEIVFDTERNYISLTGTFDSGGGQIQDRLREAYNESVTLSDDVENILAIWDDWHLKPLDTNNAEQVADLETLVTSMSNLAGKRLPEAEEGGRAEDFEEADFSNTDDVLDSRDIIARIEYLNDFLIDLPDDVTDATYDPDEDRNGDRSDAIREREKLRDLERQAENYAGDWAYGETLIHEDYFTEYAEQLVKDIGDMPDNIPRYLVIDWEATAENLKADYTAIDFSGETYYIR